MHRLQRIFHPVLGGAESNADQHTPNGSASVVGVVLAAGGHRVAARATISGLEGDWDAVTKVFTRAPDKKVTLSARRGRVLCVSALGD